MAKSRYRFIPGDLNPYFITATTVNWLPLFGNPHIAQVIFDSLLFLINAERITLISYVIMENHLHLVAAAGNLSKEIANFKSYTARTAIDYYLRHDMHSILRQLAYHKLDHKTDREYQFWQEGSHPERILDEAMFKQKVDYIHHNPVLRGYVDKPEHWRYSSARNYADLEGLLPVSIGL